MSEEKIKLSVYGILKDADRVLMQKRSNTTFANGWWSFPGGHIEPDESISSGLKREMQEECGVIINLENCSPCLTLARKPHLGKRYINLFYIITKWTGTPKISDGKASELSFHSPFKLPSPTLNYIEEALQLIERGIQFYESKF